MIYRIILVTTILALLLAGRCLLRMVREATAARRARGAAPGPGEKE